VIFIWYFYINYRKVYKETIRDAWLYIKERIYLICV